MTNQSDAPAALPALDNTSIKLGSANGESDNFNRTDLFEGFSSLNNRSPETSAALGTNNGDSNPTGQEPDELLMTDPFQGMSSTQLTSEAAAGSGGVAGRYNPVGGLVTRQDSVRFMANDPIDGNFRAGEFEDPQTEPDPSPTENPQESFTSPDLTRSPLPFDGRRIGNYDFNFRPPQGEMTAEQRDEAQREVAQFVEKYSNGMSQINFNNDIPKLVEKLNKLGMTPSGMSQALNGEFQKQQVPFVTSFSEGKSSGSLSIP